MGQTVEERILDIKVKYDDAIRGIAKYRTELDVLRKVEATLKEDLEKGRISREAYNLKLTENKIAVQQANEAIRVLNKEIQNNVTIERQQAGSLIAMRAELSNLTRTYDSLSKIQRNGDAGKKMAADIKH